MVLLVTANATTGQQWTEAQNAEADTRLETLLRGKSAWVHRMTGYSPTTLHAEPGWAVGGTLFVRHCDRCRKLVEIGPFLPRLESSGGPNAGSTIAVPACPCRLPSR